MAQNEMKAKPALPERVRSMEGLAGICANQGRVFAKVYFPLRVRPDGPQFQRLLLMASKRLEITAVDSEEMIDHRLNVQVALRRQLL